MVLCQSTSFAIGWPDPGFWPENSVFLVSKNYIDLMGKCLAGCVDCINTGVFRSSPFCCLATLLCNYIDGFFSSTKSVFQVQVDTHIFQSELNLCYTSKDVFLEKWAQSRKSGERACTKALLLDPDARTEPNFGVREVKSSRGLRGA
jgi:hypothetical protein